LNVPKVKCASCGNFGMGVAFGDFHNDGWPDMFITGYGRSILYKNNRDGTFPDITDKAGLEIPDWTTSATWFDYDNDGRLDLFVCGFVDYSSTHRFGCRSNKFGKHFYCITKVFNGTTSLLFHEPHCC
jgi:enediyne biosynthesis protein E4